MQDQLTVSLGDRSYPIFIGSRLLSERRCFAPYIHGRQVVIVTNQTVAPLYLETLETTLQDYKPVSIVLPDGEKYKNLDTLNTIYTRLLEQRINRSATLVALGGGVIGDLTGFAAASYQRGVNFIQVPTTLLAQVDSSVGGKTGVNHQLGKNMIGAFYQPQCVVADTDVLRTLEARQYSAGLAEVIKYGLIGDREFADWLNGHMQALLELDTEAVVHAVRRSCADKAAIVAEDEREKGRRALLNLGHTFGHAIETATHYDSWLHGEAVAAGMYMAARFSRDLGWIDDAALEFVEQQLLSARLPVRPPKEISSTQFMELMAVDKKVLDDRLRLVLLEAVGQAVVTDAFDQHALETMIQQVQSEQ